MVAARATNWYGSEFTFIRAQRAYQVLQVGFHPMWGTQRDVHGLMSMPVSGTSRHWLIYRYGRHRLAEIVECRRDRNRRQPVRTDRGDRPGGAVCSFGCQPSAYAAPSSACQRAWCHDGFRRAPRKPNRCNRTISSSDVYLALARHTPRGEGVDRTLL